MESIAYLNNTWRKRQRREKKKHVECAVLWCMHANAYHSRKIERREMGKKEESSKRNEESTTPKPKL